MTHVFVAMLVGLFFTGCDQAYTPDLVLLNVRVIDGTGAPPTSPVTVAIRDGRIVSVGGAAQVESGAIQSIDLAGRFLLPGFVDLHVHLPPDSAVQDKILLRLAEYGVTTILNPGAREGAGVLLRDRLSARVPRMITAGPIIEYEFADGEVAEWATLVSTEAEARAEVRRQAATTWLQAVQAGISMLVHSGWGTPMDEIVNLPDPGGATDAEWYTGYADAPNGVAFQELTAAMV